MLPSTLESNHTIPYMDLNQTNSNLRFLMNSLKKGISLGNGNITGWPIAQGYLAIVEKNYKTIQKNFQD